MERFTMSIKEAAEYSGLSKWTLYKLSAKGVLPVVKVGTRSLVLIKEFRDLLEKHRRASKQKEAKHEG